MAKPTTRIERAAPNPELAQAQAFSELTGAVAQRKDALLKFLDIVGELDDAGVLDMLQGLLKNRQQVGVIGLHQLKKSGAQRLIKNGMSAMQFMGQVDPERLKQAMGALANGLESALEKPAQPLGLWDMFRTLRDPEVGASLGMAMSFLKGVGGELPH